MDSMLEILTDVNEVSECVDRVVDNRGAAEFSVVDDSSVTAKEEIQQFDSQCFGCKHVVSNMSSATVGNSFAWCMY